MAPATNAMKAMKAMKRGGAMTVSGGYSAVAAGNGLKPEVVRSTIAGCMEWAVSEPNKNGSFKVVSLLAMKLKKKFARPARKGVNPFTRGPCVFTAKPASKIVRCLPMRKVNEVIDSGVI